MNTQKIVAVSLLLVVLSMTVSATFSIWPSESWWRNVGREIGQACKSINPFYSDLECITEDISWCAKACAKWSLDGGNTWTCGYGACLSACAAGQNIQDPDYTPDTFGCGVEG